MRLLYFTLLFYLFKQIESQCGGLFGCGGGFNNCGGQQNQINTLPQGFNSGGGVNFQIPDSPTPNHQLFNWRRRALLRRVKRAKRSIEDEGDHCPMDFLRKTVNDGMTGNPTHSMKKIYAFLTYLDRQDLGIVCSKDKFTFTSFSHGYCFQANNSTGESCLIFEI